MYFIFNKVFLIIYKHSPFPFGCQWAHHYRPSLLTWLHLEEKTLNILHLDLLFYYRYMDDIAAPTKHVTKILETFNNFHDRIQFTIEYEENRSISFLDLLLRMRDNTLMIGSTKGHFQGDTYFFTQITHCANKIGTIYGLVDRAVLLSHFAFQKKNFVLRCYALMNIFWN